MAVMLVLSTGNAGCVAEIAQIFSTIGEILGRFAPGGGSGGGGGGDGGGGIARGSTPQDRLDGIGQAGGGTIGAGRLRTADVDQVRMRFSTEMSAFQRASPGSFASADDLAQRYLRTRPSLTDDPVYQRIAREVAVAIYRPPATSSPANSGTAPNTTLPAITPVPSRSSP